MTDLQEAKARLLLKHDSLQEQLRELQQSIKIVDYLIKYEEDRPEVHNHGGSRSLPERL